jgi:hypothetical protein
MSRSERVDLGENRGSLTEQLKVKSRRRRQELVRTPNLDLSRNDPLPSLELVYFPLSSFPRRRGKFARPIPPMCGMSPPRSARLASASLSSSARTTLRLMAKSASRQRDFLVLIACPASASII